jgi:hypothetical protein
VAAGEPATAAGAATAAAVAAGEPPGTLLARWYRRSSPAAAVLPALRLLPGEGRLELRNPLPCPVAVALLRADGGAFGDGRDGPGGTEAAQRAWGALCAGNGMPSAVAPPDSCVILRLPAAPPVDGEEEVGAEEAEARAELQHAASSSPLWALPLTAGISCAPGTAHCSLGLLGLRGLEGATPVRVRMLVGIPARALLERSGAPALPPAAVGARCTLAVDAVVGDGAP